MKHLLSFWALAALVRTRAEHLLNRAGKTVPRLIGLHLRKMLRELEGIIRDALEIDAEALNIAPHTPEPCKTDAQKDTASNNTTCSFAVVLPALSSPASPAQAGVSGTPPQTLPTTPLLQRLARAVHVIENPKSYAARLARIRAKVATSQAGKSRSQTASRTASQPCASLHTVSGAHTKPPAPKPP